jgi:hypothetical protein
VSISLLLELSTNPTGKILRRDIVESLRNVNAER